MRFALSNNPDHIAGKKKSWYLRGHNRVHRIASSTQRKDKVESGAALEVVFRSCLVVRPNEEDVSVVRGYCRGVVAYICLPPKISRCCTGGMPSFSSTRSFIRETWFALFVSMVFPSICGRHFRSTIKQRVWACMLTEQR